MLKPTIALIALSLSIYGWQEIARRDPVFRLKEESLTIEYTATANEAVIVFQAESEETLRRVEIEDPSGKPIMRMWVGHGHDVALSGFVVETAESSPGEILRVYGEGQYRVNANTLDGSPACGEAVLSHQLLEPPAVLYPFEQAFDVPTDLVVQWVADPSAREYRVVLEQGESDTLSVRLPAGSNSFAVPAGVLMSNRDSHVEVGAVGANGNCTLVEIEFRTR